MLYITIFVIVTYILRVFPQTLQGKAWIVSGKESFSPIFSPIRYLKSQQHSTLQNPHISQKVPNKYHNTGYTAFMYLKDWNILFKRTFKLPMHVKATPGQALRVPVG
jgi:hypothetical protein